MKIVCWPSSSVACQYFLTRSLSSSRLDGRVAFIFSEVSASNKLIFLAPTPNKMELFSYMVLRVMRLRTPQAYCAGLSRLGQKPPKTGFLAPISFCITNDLENKYSKRINKEITKQTYLNKRTKAQTRSTRIS